MMRRVSEENHPIFSATRQNPTHTREQGQWCWASGCIKSQSIFTIATSNANYIRQLEETRLLNIDA